MAENHISTTAIILKRTDYKETSLIVKAITPDHGIITFLARGIRKSNCKYREELQLFSECSIVLQTKTNHEFYYFVEAKIIKNYITGIDFKSSILIQSVCELYLQILHPESEQEIYYELWRSFANYITTVASNKILIFWRFCFRLFYELGIELPSGECGFCHKSEKIYSGFSPIHHSFICSSCMTDALQEMSLPVGENLSRVIHKISSIGKHLDNVDLQKKDWYQMHKIFQTHLQEQYHRKIHLRAMNMLY